MKKLLKKLIPDFLLSPYHWELAFWGALVYGWPSRKLKVIGVTGTKGKSTVVMLAGKILQEAGRQVGWVSSLTINDGEKEVLNPYHMTMPGRFFIQKTLARMVKNGCEYALVEVTSEGIKQHRHRFINFFGAVLTNLAAEHIEAHGSFEKYREAKLKLFEAVAKNPKGFGVYNLDDENAKYFLEYKIKNKYGYTLKNNFQFPPTKSGVLDKVGTISPASPRLGRGRANFQSILKTSNVQLRASGSEFEIDGVYFKINLLSEFNVYNCGAAIAAGVACGVDLEIAARALQKIKSIPGRLEIIDGGQDFTVVVDLAHTPDSFQKVFRFFKNLPHHRIISVFGSAGGGRDKWKRPELGRIAAENSDAVIICNEDPYDENPSTILEDIEKGFSQIRNPKSEIRKIPDRREAIARALSLAQKDDIVLVLGKGTEQTMVIGRNKIKWDDREVVKEELKKSNRE